MNQREPVYCDCCGTVVMGYRTQDSRKGYILIVWFDQRHGVRHTVAIVVAPLDNSQKKGNDREVTGG